MILKSFMCSNDDWVELQVIAEIETDKTGRRNSVSDLIRMSIKKYVENYYTGGRDERRDKEIRS